MEEKQLTRIITKPLKLRAYRVSAGVAQLVERQLPKLDVAGSSPVSRLIYSYGIVVL